jgi:uncharacterized cupin superfamily protein
VSTSGTADARVVSFDVSSEALKVDDDSAALATASVVLASHRAVEIGLWEAGPGDDVDIETDEFFLVLSGAGRVEFADSSSIELRPGVLVCLLAGDRTRWHISERLRKLYLA